MSDLRAYECLIENVYCTVENLGELGSVKDYIDLWDIVYATTPSKAKHIFIKQQNEGYEKPGLGYTDPIKVRLLAKNVVKTDELSIVWLDADWCKAELTLRGQELVSEWQEEDLYMSGATIIEMEIELEPLQPGDEGYELGFST